MAPLRRPHRAVGSLAAERQPSSRRGRHGGLERGPRHVATLCALLLAAHASGRQAALAGLGAGLAFATRYLAVLAMPLGLLGLGGRERSQRLRHSAFLMAGFGVVAVVVLLRNVLTTGLLSDEARNASPFGFLENLGQIIAVLSGAWCSRQEPLAQRAALGLILAAGLAEAWRRRRSARESLFGGARASLAGGFALSCGFIAFLRTRTYFDIDVRMLSLVHVLMLLSLAPLLSRLAGGRARLAGALCGRFVDVTAAMAGSRPASDARALRNKPHLLWLRANADDQDLIVGWRRGRAPRVGQSGPLQSSSRALAQALVLLLDQRQELIARLLLAAEGAAHARRHGHRVLLLDAAHDHA